MWMFVGMPACLCVAVLCDYQNEQPKNSVLLMLSTVFLGSYPAYPTYVKSYTHSMRIMTFSLVFIHTCQKQMFTIHISANYCIVYTCTFTLMEYAHVLLHNVKVCAKLFNSNKLTTLL